MQEGAEMLVSVRITKVTDDEIFYEHRGGQFATPRPVHVIVAEVNGRPYNTIPCQNGGVWPLCAPNEN